MDELPPADVDALVARAGEEDEVARLELAYRNRRTHAELGVRAVRQRDADLGEDVHDETGAVEASRRSPAPDVGNAEVAHRDPDDPAVRRRRGHGRAFRR